MQTLARRPAAGLRQLLVNPGVKLTRADTQVIRVLLADFPGAGLGTVAGLARRAGVSDPTVTRLIIRLGFDGFYMFQQALLAELDGRIRSPLSLMKERRLSELDGKPNIVREYLRSVASCLTRSEVTTPAQSYEVAVNLILGAKGRVLLLGGRFSRHLAGMLGSYLREIRADIVDIGLMNATNFDVLIDLTRHDLLLVFDYRRYQMDVVRFGQQAADRGVGLVLFTDCWQSPLADRARATLTAETESSSPHDSLVAPVAQIEALVKRLLARRGDAAHNRLKRMEEVRALNSVPVKPPGSTTQDGAPRRVKKANKHPNRANAAPKSRRSSWRSSRS